MNQNGEVMSDGACSWCFASLEATESLMVGRCIPHYENVVPMFHIASDQEFVS